MTSMICGSSRFAGVNGALRCLLFCGLLAGGGCATAPLSTTTVNSQLTPQQVAQAIVSAATEQEPLQVSWGGVVVNSTNLPQMTEIEVLAYPLDRIQRPVVDAAPVGRFLLRYPGYLETLDYAPGRVLTAVGVVSGVETGRVSQSDYQFAVLESSDLHLWRHGALAVRPRVSFGIGISLSN